MTVDEGDRKGVWKLKSDKFMTSLKAIYTSPEVGMEWTFVAKKH